MLELLEREPGNWAFLPASKELARRNQGREAIAILERGLELHPGHREGWVLLATVAIEADEHLRCLMALEAIAPTPERDPDLVVLQIRALVGIGQVERAAALADSVLLLHPELEVQAMFDRAGGLPDPRLRGIDPQATAGRAEAYVAAGRVDRAIRIYRRLLFHHPEDARLRSRLLELLERPLPERDDLSEELPDPAQLRLAGIQIDDEEITMPVINVSEVRRRVAEVNRPLPGLDEVRRALLDDETGEEAPTDIMSRAKLLEMPDLRTVALDIDIMEARLKGPLR